MAKGSGGIGKGGKAGSVSGGGGGTGAGALSMAGVPAEVKALGATEAQAWAGIQAAMKAGNTSLPLMTDAIKHSGLSKEAFHGAAQRMWDKGVKGFVMHNHDIPSQMSSHAASGAMTRTLKSEFGSSTNTYHAVSVPE
jgi:hypothetical protein